MERRSLATEVLFVGHWEPDRAARIAALRRAGVNVKVWGKGWWRAWNLADRREIGPMSNSDYPKAIAAAKVLLCFLSKFNRNECCGRTFEIPAVGGFLLAERTAEQVSYFSEDREAAFFGSEKELVEKARYFLAREDERRDIAARGHQRCVTSGYTYRARIAQDMKAVLEVLA
jgi:spore maturation protein CgeB